MIYTTFMDQKVCALGGQGAFFDTPIGLKPTSMGKSWNRKD